LRPASVRTGTADIYRQLTETLMFKPAVGHVERQFISFTYGASDSGKVLTDLSGAIRRATFCVGLLERFVDAGLAKKVCYFGKVCIVNIRRRPYGGCAALFTRLLGDGMGRGLSMTSVLMTSRRAMVGATA
jgi:hypothetical protein